LLSYFVDCSLQLLSLSPLTSERFPHSFSLASQNSTFNIGLYRMSKE
jgi:hypothetical protein